MVVKKRPSEKRKKRPTPTGPPKGRQPTYSRTLKRAEESTQPGSNTTPQVAPYLSTFLYTSATSTLTQCRKDVMYDVGAIDEIPFLKLLEAILPIDDPQNAMEIWKIVKSRANIVTGDSWTAFQQLPSQQSGTEESVFKPLKGIYQAITGASGKTYSQEVQFGVHGSKTPASDWPNQTRPDGSIHLKKTSLPYGREDGIVDHADICCYMEFKKHNNASFREDNARKVVYNAHHRFRHDPRCRHVFGLTIEDTSTRFWYFSRATVAVSEPFDFRKLHFPLDIQEHLSLVRLFLAFACSSLERLGFDTAMRCIAVTQFRHPSKQRDGHADADPNNAKGAFIATRRTRRLVTQKQSKSKNYSLGLTSASPEQVLGSRVYEFTIQVNEEEGTKNPQNGSVRTFRTLRCISNSVGIRSRGTRVYEVTDVKIPGSIYVLKDVWVDRDHTVEGKTLLDIRGRLEQEDPEAPQHFLDVEYHGVVTLNGKMDLASSIPSESKGGWKEYDPTAEFSDIGQKRGSNGSIKDLVGSWQVLDENEASLKRRISRGDLRQHYRIVFKGRPATPVNHLSIDNAFVALVGGAKAVWAMYKLGYIHRDVSCGNILLVDGEKGPTGVLIDLEYANKFPRSDIAPRDRRMGTREFMANEVHAETFFHVALGVMDAPKWFHHPIHDVESIWWIALWTFHFLQVSPDEQKKALFPDSGTGSRSEIWGFPGSYTRLCGHLPTTIQTLFYEWLQFIDTQHRSLQATFGTNEAYKSFDYNDACKLSIKFIKDIQFALQGIRAQEAPNEDEGSTDAENADDRPRKRLKTEGIDDT